MNSILIVAHPGHELRIFHWLERARPMVCILTDGSGGDKVSRVAYSAKCIAAAGATPGPVLGFMSDQQWYRAILARDATPFHRVVDAIVATAGPSNTYTVVSDAVDGYNPVHDLTSAVGAAVAAKLRAKGAAVCLLASAAVPGVAATLAQEFHLDDAATARKNEAVRAYLPLAEEAQRILRADPEATAREALLEGGFDWPLDFKPQWEEFGKDRVDMGRYPTRITYLEHVRPVALSIIDEAATQQR